MASASDKVEVVAEQTEQLNISKGTPATTESVQHSFSMHNRSVISKVLEAGLDLVGQSIVVGGWVKTGRIQDKGAFCFLELNDGSCAGNFQVMVTSEVHDLKPLTATGSSVLVRGELSKSPEGTKQLVELKATEILFFGPSDPKANPIAKGKLSLEFLRSQIHLRIRTNTIAAVTRIRNTLAAATHEFFQKHGFSYVQTPLLTSSDCEGAGEMFQVTTLLSAVNAAAAKPIPSAESLAEAQEKVKAQGEVIRTMKEEKKDKRKIKAEVEKLDVLKSEVRDIKELQLGGLPRKDDNTLDMSRDFFSKPAFLTVSGQLEAEIYACAMTSVYTFGPTFRAEDSHTTRHLAEFWMIEPEIAFCELDGNMKCAEQYVQYCCQAVLDRCRPDMEFLCSRYDKEALARLENVVKEPFGRISYTEAIELLQEHVKEGKKSFEENNIEWGMDLASEHERYIAEEVFKKPVAVYNYPAAIKSFYMRMNDDKKTVAAMDVLVPGVGELIGGSQREERLDDLIERIQAAGLERETYEWYLDLRRFGTVPHSGFGLGFERLVLFCTGMTNIRDVIPFPRYPGHIL